MGCFFSLPNAEAEKAPRNSVQRRKSAVSNHQRQLGVSLSGSVVNPKQRALICALKGDDAQQMVDFLDLHLRETSSFTDVWKHELSLLEELAKSAKVYPRCYALKGVKYDARPVVGGSLVDVYKGEYKGQRLCLKVFRVFGQRNHDLILGAHAKETVLWAQLSHPNILPFYGVYLLDRRICMVSPWMENGNLRDYLEEHLATPRIPLLLDITNGLEYLHQAGIAHGDLKATNVLVSDHHRALITDFGQSSIVNATPLASMTPISKGMPHWRAPEQLTGNFDTMHPTVQSDIWSFGCLCYEVMARKTPFYQYGESQVVSILLTGKEIPKGPSPGDGGEEINSDIWSIMTRCWNYAPRERPTCQEIQSFIANLRIHDDRPRISAVLPDTSEYWKAMKNASGSQVDFERVERILHQLQANSAA